MRRKGEALPDPGDVARHELLMDLLPAIEDVQAGMVQRGVEFAETWLKRVAFDSRVSWI